MRELAGSTASLVESIKFTRVPGRCENSDQHDRYEISWTDLDGKRDTSHVYWCPHPFCDTTSWRLSTAPYVLLTRWVGPDTEFRIPHIATAYLLLIADPEGRRFEQVVARVGICDQWQDRAAGNIGEPGERRLFTERYFAESGPGVYPAPIVEYLT